MVQYGLPCGSDDQESTCNVGDLGLIPRLGRSPRGGHDNLAPVFLPGESLWTEEPGGLQSMGPKESGTTERVSTHSTVYTLELDQRRLCFCHHGCPGKLMITLLILSESSLETRCHCFSPLPSRILHHRCFSAIQSGLSVPDWLSQVMCLQSSHK